MTEIAITGLGVVCRLGRGVTTFWAGVRAGATAAADQVPDPDLKVELPLYYLVPGGSSDEAPATRYTVDAGLEAYADAGLDAVPGARVAVVMGSSVGDARQVELARAGQVPPVADASPPFTLASRLAARIDAGAGAVNLSNACAGSGYAIALGAEMIRTGEADVVVAGGAEAYSRVTVAAFNQMGALAPDRPRPFAEDRAGVVLGEGAGAVVLESVAHARARGAQVYARLAGTGWSCDAAHPTAPDPTGAQAGRAMRAALAEAGAGPDDVTLIVPHATGTKLNDSTEAAAMGAVFGTRLAAIPLHNLKAVVGHLAGGAGVLGAALAALCFHHGTVPGNPATSAPDPACPVHLPTGPTALQGGIALVNAYAFGGNNISLALTGAPS
ncbi:beta-ketoacyl synthase N-terminal-like domain-containing protein [Streptomyces sp. NPDC047043]|uniref:beta-ketoacyl-[acyl-carrier-protein] synthase family protein n=1 Tax=Streptomyces sp. NPDC047043 TaxID=3154497 RepID=UPI0033EE6500